MWNTKSDYGPVLISATDRWGEADVPDRGHIRGAYLKTYDLIRGWKRQEVKPAIDFCIVVVIIL
jgi:hypothetical protein